MSRDFLDLDNNEFLFLLKFFSSLWIVLGVIVIPVICVISPIQIVIWPPFQRNT